VTGEGASLLDFLGAPVLVGDPEGRVVYANPAFGRIFRQDPGDAAGEPLAAVFAGGAREAVLNAVAAICDGADHVPFKVREANRDFLGLASPIAAEGGAVGVVLLFTDEPEQDPRLRVFQHEVREPLEEAAAALAKLREQAVDPHADAPTPLAEQAAAALERAQRWSDELLAALNGERTRRTPSLDPVRVLREVGRRVAPDFERAGVRLDGLYPNELPAAAGEEALLETALVRVLRHRLVHAGRGEHITLSARTIGHGSEAAMLISVAAPCLEDHSAPLPAAVDDTVSVLDGRMQTVVEPTAGVATGFRLALSS